MERTSPSKLCKESLELAEQILHRADELHVTIGSAESCTGGLIASTFTEVPGSSNSFVGAVVSYWVSVKEQVLGVDPSVIDEHGVVSEQTARAMAQGARRILDCDYAVSTTGIAGPSGAEPGKPVGTVCFCVAGPRDEKTFTICEGESREEVRAHAVRTALVALREMLG